MAHFVNKKQQLLSERQWWAGLSRIERENVIDRAGYKGQISPDTPWNAICYDKSGQLLSSYPDTATVD